MERRWWIERLLPKIRRRSYIRDIVTGSMYRISDIRGNTSISDMRTEIDTMRALARDSQINTALSYYATDATTPNTAGQIIWATDVEGSTSKVAEIINDLFKRWKVNKYARDHILELATIGNLYIPTTDMFKEYPEGQNVQYGVALDNNTMVDEEFDIIPSTKIPPEDVVHLWLKGKPEGYIYQPTDPDKGYFKKTQYISYPEQSIIHFSLGGLLGNFSLEVQDDDGNIIKYDIQFSDPLLDAAVQPTQTLSLLEDALLLSSLARTIKFINVECGNEPEEIRDTLQQIKDAIEQQLSINTSSGDSQSFVNPQSPNNLIYLPRINGNDAISITDLNMADASAEDSKLLDHYQNKKLSVLGVPKEAMNFTSNEGLGNAGNVLSQRSALYANALRRLETAYIEGWTDALNKYFENRGLSGFVDQFQLHMQPIVTTQSTVVFERRDSALSQASSYVQLLKDLKVDDQDDYLNGLSEILTECFPQIGALITNIRADVNPDEGSGGGDVGEF